MLVLKVDPFDSATALCLPQQPTSATSLLSPPGIADGRFRLALRHGPVTSLSHESRDCEALVIARGDYCLLNATVLGSWQFFLRLAGSQLDNFTVRRAQD